MIVYQSAPITKEGNRTMSFVSDEKNGEILLQMLGHLKAINMGISFISDVEIEDVNEEEDV